MPFHTRKPAAFLAAIDGVLAKPHVTSRQSIGHPSPTSAKACTTGVLFSLPPFFFFFFFPPPIFFFLKIHVWKLCSLQCRLTYEHCSKHTRNISSCRTKGAVSIDTGVNWGEVRKPPTYPPPPPLTPSFPSPWAAVLFVNISHII